MRNVFSRSSGRIRFVALLSLALCGLLPLWLWADAPAWWAERGVLSPNATPDDYAAVNQGQLKNIAKQAYEEMKEHGVIDPVAAAASTNPDDPARRLFLAWQTLSASTDDYQAINLGQIKNVAEPFYARLQELNYTGQPLASGQTRPWSGTADDYALANIGQVKNVFSFEIESMVDGPVDLVVTPVSETSVNLAWSVGSGIVTIVQVTADNGVSWKTLSVLTAGISNYSASGLSSAAASSFRVLKSANGMIGTQTVDWMQSNGLDPSADQLDQHSDDDGLSDGEETAIGTNPKSNDTDGDTINDNDDGWPRDPKLSPPVLPSVKYAVIPLAPANGWPITSPPNVYYFPESLDDSGRVLIWKRTVTGSTEVDSVGIWAPGEGFNLIPGLDHVFYNGLQLQGSQADYQLIGHSQSRDGWIAVSCVPPSDGVKLYHPDHDIINILPSEPPHESPADYASRGLSVVCVASRGRSLLVGTGSSDYFPLSGSSRANYAISSPILGPGGIGRTESWSEVVYSSSDWGNPTLFGIPFYRPLLFNDEGVTLGCVVSGVDHNFPGETLTQFLSCSAASLQQSMQASYFALGSGVPAMALGDKDGMIWRAVKNDSNEWDERPLKLWNAEAQLEQDPSMLLNGVINRRREMLFYNAQTGKGDVVRNGVMRSLDSLVPAAWTEVYGTDINNHGVIFGEATRVVDDSGAPITNPQSQSVLLVPYEVLTDDPSFDALRPTHADVVAPSSPKPEVEIKVESATITANGSLSVVMSGTVSDALSEVLLPTEPRVAQMRFKVDGQTVGTPVALDYTAVTNLLRRARSRTIFEQTLVIPNAKPRGYTIVAETDANAAGNTGWDKVAVGVNAELIPYTDSATKLSVVFAQLPTASTPGIATVYFGTRSPMAGDGTVTETAAGSGSYIGTLKVGTTTATCTIKIHQAISLTSGTAETLSATLIYQLPEQAAVKATGIWQETGAATQHFLPDGYSFSGERLVVNHTQDLPGSQPSSFEPLVLCLGVPAAWAQAAGFALTANGQPLTLKEFTYDGRTDTYAVTNSSDTYPRIFVPSSHELPASIAVANASGEGDSIDWVLSLGGNPSLTIQTQVVAGPAPFASELLAAHISSLPLWVSTDPGAGVGGSSSGGTPANDWNAPGDTVSVTDLREAYALLYPDGFSKLLLDVFDAQSGYTIELGDVYEDYDFDYDNGAVTIQIEEDDDDINPVIAAQYLWQGLNYAHATVPAFRKAVVEHLASVPLNWTTQGLTNEAYMTWHANAGKAAAQAGVAVAELYLSGIGIVNEGLDWVLVINDVTEGHYTSLAALLPFVPRAIVSSGGRYVVRNTSGVVRETISTLSKFDAIPALYREVDLRVMGITMEREQFGLFLRKALSSSGGPIPVPKTHGQLRRAMERAGPIPTLTKVQAHHDFPWKFKVWFAQHGVDVNNPAFGRWVAESDHDLWHKRAMPKFNDFWQNWMTQETTRPSPYTFQEIMDKLAEARATYPVTNGN